MNINIKSNWLKALIGINSIIYVLAIIAISSNDGISSLDRILVFGEFFSGAVEEGMIWLLTTSNFLHYDLFHFILNMIALYQIGRLVEIFYGGKKLIGTYILGGLGGSLATLIWASISNEAIASIGASGAIFGLLGLLVGGTFKTNRYSANLPFKKEDFYPTLLLSIAISFLPMINWAAHLGGFLVGLAMGLFFQNTLGPRSQNDKSAERWIYYSSLLILGFSYIFLVLNLIFEFIELK